VRTGDDRPDLDQPELKGGDRLEKEGLDQPEKSDGDRPLSEPKGARGSDDPDYQRLSIRN
jgi:hypothetical protein